MLGLHICKILPSVNHQLFISITSEPMLYMDSVLLYMNNFFIDLIYGTSSERVILRDKKNGRVSVTQIYLIRTLLKLLCEQAQTFYNHVIQKITWGQNIKNIIILVTLPLELSCILSMINIKVVNIYQYSIYLSHCFRTYGYEE